MLEQLNGKKEELSLGFFPIKMYGCMNYPIEEKKTDLTKLLDHVPFKLMFLPESVSFVLKG